MSRYAFDQQRHALIVSWGTGIGDIAATLTELPAATAPDAAVLLAHALTRLSEALWRTYTHPASSADKQGANTEGWEREQDREAFTQVISALSEPNLPRGGLLIQSYIPTEEGAHQVGRTLHAIGNPELTERIVADVKAELDALERAELGDLSGRARQAVTLSHAGASPTQIEAADRLLKRAPLGTIELFTDVDPAAAAVAAAHWLQAAADVTAAASELDPAQIVQEADNIEALPHECPTAVLELLEEGLRPYDAVTGLIRDAMTVAEGEIPNVHQLRDRIDETVHLAREFAANDPSLLDRLLEKIRTTPLDPMRPAHDLLENLLEGIRGCWLLYKDTIELDDTDGLDDDDFTKAFIDAVRAEAEENRDRLL